MNKYIQDMLDRQAYIDQNMQQKDPFDKGIMRAVSSAKQSLGMDEEQSDRALRNSLLSFSDALYQDQTPMGKGFMGKFAALGRAMNPALRTHDQYEDLAQNENMQLAKEAQNFRAMEEAKMAKMEQDAYIREMNDQKMALEQEKLNEMRDYHNQSLLAKLAAQRGQFIEHEGKPYRQLDKVGQREANNLKSGINSTQHDLDKINNYLEDLKTLTKNNAFQPIGGLSSITNPVKDAIGRTFGADSYQNETAKRELLYALLGKFRVNAERNLKGSGTLGQGFYDRMSPFFPNENDDLPTLEAKLKDATEEMNLQAKVANTSANKGIAYDIGDVLNESSTNTSTNNNGDRVLMVDPETGEQDYVPRNRVEEAINIDGLQVVNE
jgi:hypothetical protein